MKIVYIFFGFTIFNFSGILAQSNTPCGGGVVVAPNLPVNAVCAFTAGTTVGATQQTNGNNGGTPSCGSMGPDVWYSMTVPASGAINLTTQAGTIIDGVMAVYTGTCGSWTQIACADDVIGTMPSISVSSLAVGSTILVRFWQFGGGTGTFSICATIGVAPPPPPGNTTCAAPSPVCSGSPISFIANSGGTPASTVNPGNNYSCLITSPNPSWYYLQISQAGNLVIDITAGADVDYSIWGPFTSLPNAVASCNSYAAPSDCSYSPSPIEQAVINGVTVGQVYVLLVTNFANVPQMININEAAANSAATNCAIVPLPVNFSEFSAKENDDLIAINWSTESENNSDFYVVEHSNDGKDWWVMDVVKSVGNTSLKSNYSSVHRSPTVGKNYYRLSQIDLNGKITKINPVSENFGIMNDFTVYPNPSNGTVYLGEKLKNIDNISAFDNVGTTIPISYVDESGKVKIIFPEDLKGLVFIQVKDFKGKTLVKRIIIE